MDMPKIGGPSFSMVSENQRRVLIIPYGKGDISLALAECVDDTRHQVLMDS